MKLRAMAKDVLQALNELEGFTMYYSMISERLRFFSFKNGYQVGITNNVISIDKEIALKKILLTIKAYIENEKAGLIPNAYLGGYNDGSYYYLDISLFIENYEKAMQLARIFRQNSIWSWKDSEVIKL